MYPPGIVIVQVRRQAFLDSVVCCFVVQPIAETLFLDSPVEPFNVGIVVGLVQPGMPGVYAVGMEPVFEVPAELRAIVTLDHGEPEAEQLVRLQDNSRSNAWSNAVMDFSICHAAV